MAVIKFFIKYLIIIALFFGAGYFYGTNKVKIDWKNYFPKINVENKQPPSNNTELDLSTMWVVLEKLEANYYDKTKLDAKKMQHGAIAGLVSSLDDQFTLYLPPKENKEFRQTLAQEFGGIGAELGTKDKNIIVIAPLEGSPASKADVRAGDIILKVDNKPVYDMPINKVVEMIRGEKGTKVVLSIVHRDEQEIKEVSIIRDAIQTKSVYMWVKKIDEIGEISKKAFSESVRAEKIAYIRLSQFGERTNQEWLSFVNKLSLQIQSDKSIKGLVLDLRNNPGGYLQDATYIAADFIPIGKPVVIQQDGKGEKLVLKTDRPGLLLDFPLVILINRGSASASEILSGAMRDYDRAKLIGETSFGKGTIQTSEDLGNGAGINITVAKWLTPKEIWVHQKGLEPDIKVDPDLKDRSRDAQLEKAITELVK